MHKSTTRSRRNVLRHDLNQLKDILTLTAQDVGGQAKLALTESYENMKDKSADIQGSVKNYVHDKPFKALGIATLCGLVLGLTMHKKRKHYR